MTRPGIWLLPLLLVGCASQSSGDSPDAVCQRQAYDDPKVKHLMMPASVPTVDHDFDLTLALREATQKCLVQKGVAVRGGVEPVRRD